MGLLRPALSHFRKSLAATPRLALSSVAGAMAKFLRVTFDGPGMKYHPEQHYMRGPGPKWREKHLFDVTTRGA